MTTYERRVGALPPGARGIRGGGRSEHSTNLSLGQPVSTSHASLPAEEDATTETPEPKKQRKRSPSSRSTSRSTSSKSANTNALNVIQGFDSTLMRLVDRFPGGKSTVSKEENPMKAALLDRKNQLLVSINLLKDHQQATKNASKAYKDLVDEFIGIDKQLKDMMPKANNNIDLSKDSDSDSDSDGSKTTLG